MLTPKSSQRARKMRAIRAGLCSRCLEKPQRPGAVRNCLCVDCNRDEVRASYRRLRFRARAERGRQRRLAAERRKLNPAYAEFSLPAE